MNIRSGDTVQVVSGDDRGKKGKVLSVNPKKGQVIVEGINFMKHHSKPTQQNPQGGIIEREGPVQVSNVMLVSSGGPTRVGYRFLETGRKIRVARKTGEDIDS